MMLDIDKGKNPFKRRHWKLTGDGDLWYHLYLAIKAKCTRAIQFTWVKGHATEDHIAQGVTTRAHKIGNDAADQVADAGTDLHGTDLCKIACWLYHRSVAYTNFMKCVSHHIIEAYLIHRVLVERIARAETAAAERIDKRITYRPLSYGSRSHGYKLQPSCSLANFKSYVQANPKSTSVQDFLCELSVCDISHNCPRPITWIELYILYRLRGHVCLTHCDVEPAYAKPTPDTLIRDFKNCVRAVVKRSFVNMPHATLFKPAQAKRDAQIGVGILGNMACPSFNVVVTDVECKHIANALVLLSRDLNGKHVCAFIDGTYKVIPKVLALNGKAGWAPTAFKDCCVTTRHCSWPVLPSGGAGVRIKNTEFYQCALCHKVEPNTCSAFQYSDLDARHICFHCKKASSVIDWTCSCGDRWFLCHRHCKSPSACTTSSRHGVAKQQTASSSSTSRKRTLDEVSSPSYEQLLEQDLRKEERRAKPRQASAITLCDSADIPPVRPSMLPPSLRRRFNL